MKFLVIGASGFIGKTIFEYIKSLGYEAVGTQYKFRHPEFIIFNILEQRIKDCVEPTFFKTDRPVFGIICSAISQIDRCLREKEISYKLNVENTIRFINEMKSLGVIPVFLSSDNIHNGFHGYYTEEDKPSPINEYGRQKAEVERFMLNNVSNGIILRLSKIVGDNPKEHHLFSEWYQLIKEKKTIACIKGQVFSPTFVKDIAKAVVLLCEKGSTGLYNVANKEIFSRAELARQFSFAIGEKNI